MKYDTCLWPKVAVEEPFWSHGVLIIDEIMLLTHVWYYNCIERQ